ncbi:MAG: PhzF family phenazine biosynthesis protein [Methylococcales bacterium]|nr:PhzF family phenazine biosynthesis protein [Methylococcales bacterium]
MKYKYYITDVFTNRIFNGAQVAVFPEADGLNSNQMALVAEELNLFETVFIFHKEGAEDIHKMKIFSPRGEIDFAGHPVVAAAYVLAYSGNIEVKEPYTPLVFEQNSGLMNVNVTWKEGKPSFVQFSRNVSPIVDYYTPTVGEIADFLNIDSGSIDDKKYSPRLVSCGFPYLVVPVFYYETLKQAKFNYSAWSQSIAPQTAAQEILLFSSKTPFQYSDFSVRLVGPSIGSDVEPPVGTAMPAFASYLCSFDHLQKGTYTFAVDRGEEKTRWSMINLEMDHKGEDELTLRVGGEAVTVAEGYMNIPDYYKE